MDTSAGFSGSKTRLTGQTGETDEIYTATTADFSGSCEAPEHLQGSTEPAYVPVGSQ